MGGAIGADRDIAHFCCEFISLGQFGTGVPVGCRFTPTVAPGVVLARGGSVGWSPEAAPGSAGATCASAATSPAGTSSFPYHHVEPHSLTGPALQIVTRLPRLAILDT